MRDSSGINYDASSRITQDSGGAKWLPGGYTHTLTNTGKSTARLVTVELKP